MTHWDSFTIQYKMFLQQLWQLKVNWDEPLPTEFQEQWQRLQHNLPSIQSIQIDRLVISKHKLKEIEKPIEKLKLMVEWP